ncbi:MAG: S-malonyltransferase [Pseudomonadota bacterium]|jgi:[acyl-carrier-protein] S-malonyltransferase
MKEDTIKKMAFVFPGQGSQSLGMLADLAEKTPIVKSCFAEASSVLGYDLWQLTQEGPEEQLNQTQYTQPALLAAGVAFWRFWCEKYPNQRPLVMAGHSLGEYTALVCANSLDFKEAIKIVSNRGRFMQEAVPQGKGAMAAILGLTDEQVQVACREASEGDIVSAANYNSKGQVVIAGETQAVERAMDRAKAMGARKTLLLPVSVPSHCALMAPASLRLAQQLRETTFNVPNIPVLHNVDLAFHQTKEAIQDALINQLVRPVRWVETIQLMETLGIERIIECGPGRVLCGLIKRIVPSIESISLNDCREETCL